MTQAYLPDNLYESRIVDMEVGTSGWTAPWVMCVDEDGSLWLHGKAALFPEPGGIISMLVTYSEEGYEVEMGSYFGRQYKWSPKPHLINNDSVPVVRFTQR